MTIDGNVAPGFERVREAFAANFSRTTEPVEVGAGLAVYHRGKRVVDLWGGFADAARTRAWTEDTYVNVWSVTKGITALAVAMLVDRGRLRYEDRVAQHWPEFAAAGKGAVTVEQMLSHQAGLNGFVEPTTVRDFYDWGHITRRLAAQAPFWPPGEYTSYHPLTFGFLAGELIRRIDGRGPRAFVQDEIAGKLGAAFHIGLPEALAGQAAMMIAPPEPTVPPPEPHPLARPATTNPSSSAAWPASPDWRAAEVPAANGHATAAGLARIYALLGNGGELDGVRIISASGIEALRKPRSERIDLALRSRNYGAGVVINTTGQFGRGKRAFGHTGWGGSFGCADPEAGLGIGYVINRMGAALGSNPRAVTVLEAIYQSIE
jgi:CubicO group peptidase (beta-lactamase class C family)